MPRKPKNDAPETPTDPLAGLSDENATAAVHDLLTMAQKLADEKTDVFERIDANRKILREYKRLGMLSEKQSGAIDLFYPPVKTKPKDAAPAEDAPPATGDSNAPATVAA